MATPQDKFWVVGTFPTNRYLSYEAAVEAAQRATVTASAKDSGAQIYITESVAYTKAPVPQIDVIKL